MVFLRSVKNWLTLLFLGIVAVAAGVTWLYVVPSLRSRLEHQKLATQLRSADDMSNTIPRFLSLDPRTLQWSVTAANEKGLDTAAAILGLRLSARVMVFDRRLIRIWDSGRNAPFDVDDFGMLASAVRKGRVVQGIVQSSSGSAAATAVALVSRASPRTVLGAVLVVSPLTDVENSVDAVQRRLVFAAGLALIVSLLTGYLASYFIARRLKRIERSAEAIAGGDYGATVSVGLEDEVGELARSFNTMGGRLHDAFTQVEEERNRAVLLVNNLSEGVVGVSAGGRVTIFNPAAAALLGESIGLGADIGDSLPEEVARAWRESRESDSYEEVVFVHGERTLQALAYPAASDADFRSILVVRDVTAEAKLDRARRDFVANASHEFKTPLFSLSGFLELFDEGNLEPEEQAEFLQLMRQQVDRLRDLSLSMLDLSRVEAGSIALNPEPTDLVAVSESVVAELQTQATAAQVDLRVEAQQSPLIATCDEQRLAQVLRALVDNAVKFSPSGGAVRLVVEGDASAASIAVCDQGPGIPPEDLPHVFERFHRGRKDRANKSGAGLGLAIARELTELMGGELTVHSVSGQGSRFTVVLPRSRVTNPSR
jgi:signal transduction histidine kinase